MPHVSFAAFPYCRIREVQTPFGAIGLKQQRQIFKVSEQLHVRLHSLAQTALLQSGIVHKPYSPQTGFVAVCSQEERYCTTEEWNRK